MDKTSLFFSCMLFFTSLVGVSTVMVAQWTELNVVQQSDGYSCGYHAVANALLIQDFIATSGAEIQLSGKTFNAPISNYWGSMHGQVKKITHEYLASMQKSSSADKNTCYSMNTNQNLQVDQIQTLVLKNGLSNAYIVALDAKGDIYTMYSPGNESLDMRIKGIISKATRCQGVYFIVNSGGHWELFVAVIDKKNDSLSFYHADSCRPCWLFASVRRSTRIICNQLQALCIAQHQAVNASKRNINVDQQKLKMHIAQKKLADAKLPPSSRTKYGVLWYKEIAKKIVNQKASLSSAISRLATHNAVVRLNYAFDIGIINPLASVYDVCLEGPVNFCCRWINRDNSSFFKNS